MGKEIISGIRNAAAVAIQVGNARLIQENRSRILKRQVNFVRSENYERGNRKRMRQKQNMNPLSSTTTSTSTSSAHSNRPVTELLLPSSFSVASAC
jgi:hypothetical protein